MVLDDQEDIVGRGERLGVGFEQDVRALAKAHAAHDQEESIRAAALLDEDLPGGEAPALVARDGGGQLRGGNPFEQEVCQRA